MSDSQAINTNVSDGVSKMGSYRSVGEARSGLLNFVEAISGPNLQLRPLKGQIRNAEWFTISSARLLKPHRYFFDIMHSVTYSHAFEALSDPAPGPLAPNRITFPESDYAHVVVWNDLLLAQPNDAPVDEEKAVKNRWYATAATILIATGERSLMPTDSAQTCWMYLMIVISLATDPVEGKLFPRKELLQSEWILAGGSDRLKYEKRLFAGNTFWKKVSGLLSQISSVRWREAA
ncbi:unnamed protein product [Heligmosomoides polygyrus]|uniref:Fungal_trans domain-containing protein n=1 Tax=Heligmosomoides polygyrus TaxID=6339 RepID=A0A183G2K5_HELPZ|nr:unnamed protein product [Heligmosomoides polygyrus]